MAHDEEGPVLRVAATRGADGGIEHALDQRRRHRVGLEVTQRAGSVDRLEQADGRLRRKRCGHGFPPFGMARRARRFNIRASVADLRHRRRRRAYRQCPSCSLPGSSPACRPRHVASTIAPRRTASAATAGCGARRPARSRHRLPGRRPGHVFDAALPEHRASPFRRLRRQEHALRPPARLWWPRHLAGESAVLQRSRQWLPLGGDQCRQP